MTQSEVAEKLGLTTNYISLVENDKREPSLSFLKELSEILEVPIGLFFLDSDMSRKDITQKEKALLMRIRDLMFQIEGLRLEESG